MVEIVLHFLLCVSNQQRSIFPEACMAVSQVWVQCSVQEGQGWEVAILLDHWQGGWFHWHVHYKCHLFYLVGLLPRYHGAAVAVKEEAALDNCRH